MAKLYDPKNVLLTVNGTIITGYADGSFITSERNEDTFKEHVGAQGEVSLSETANTTGKITVKLQSTSPSVEYLNTLAQSKAVYPATIIDRNKGTSYGGTECRVRRPANADFSNEITTREFEIFVSDYKVE